MGLEGKILGLMARKIVLILLLCSAGLWAFQATVHKPVVSTSTGTTGRYQIVINPNVRADTYLLDTQTGQVWQSESFGKNGSEAWVHQSRLDTDEDFYAFMLAHPDPTPTPKP